MRRNRLIIIFLVVLAFLAIGLSIGSRIFTEYLWFGEVGFISVYVKILLTKIFLFFAVFFLFFIFLYGNLLLARRATVPKWRVTEDETIEKIREGFSKASTLILLGVALFLALIAASSAPNRWDLVLRYFNQTSFGLVDPIFNRDVSFYIFTLPFYRYLYSFLMSLFVLALFSTAAIYFFSGGITYGVFQQRLEVSMPTRVHLSVLAGLIFILKAFDYLFRQWELLYSARGAAFGASYTDIYAGLPVLKILVFIALFSALLFLINIYFRGLALPVSSVILLMVTSSVGGNFYPALIQRFVVSPNELAKEKRFIRYNIDFTRKAYGLDKIKEKSFPAEETLTLADLEKNQGTVKNIRLWDWRPLQKTYSQVQEIRLYYTFKDIDVDRYHLDGEYRQILLSPREFSALKLPEKAKTWVNEHLVFTHGYGLTASPASEISPEGLPNLLIKDIPPVSSAGLKVRRPEIYYGEEANGYVVVNGKEKEFDYPKGDKNVYTSYRGKGGIPLSNTLRKAAFSWKFSDLKLFLSGAITPQSRIMFRRQIKNRVRTIAPFLQFDQDPYLVLSEAGKLYWIFDAYTTSTKYPYSEPFEGRSNYIRNSVKIVIDAYHGNLDFYIVDPKDPLIKTYQKIFPHLFKPISSMPADLKKHIRYPLDLFEVQSKMYATYHMKEPSVFYNKEDQWSIPKEIFEEQEQEVKPYYVIMKLPGESEEKFILLLPFVPSNKNNMIAWLSANSDLPGYGELLVYKFPKQKLIFGPEQIEARINQDPEISRQLTLWGQRGSEIIRGNLLVIPIEESLLYVEPLYLQAERSELPELKRVVVAYGNRVSMEETLDEALGKVFGGAPTPLGAGVSARPKEPLPSEVEGEKDIPTLTNQALETFNRAQEALKRGDFATYGQEIKNLEEILKTLKEQTQQTQQTP